LPLRSFLAAMLAIQFAISTCFGAQDPVVIPPKAATQEAPTPASAAMVPGTLKVLILEGNGARNSVDSQRVIAPVVEIRDMDDRPVEAATVVFRMPASAPGGYFAGQQLSKSAITNIHGQVTSGPFTPTALGRFQIHVTATAGNRMGEADLSQLNTADQVSMVSDQVRPKKKSHLKWILIGAGAAGAAVAVILITRSSGSSTPTITISPGPVTIGGH
jgi:hypothetical protein